MNQEDLDFETPPGLQSPKLDLLKLGLRQVICF